MLSGCISLQSVQALQWTGGQGTPKGWLQRHMYPVYVSRRFAGAAFALQLCSPLQYSGDLQLLLKSAFLFLRVSFLATSGFRLFSCRLLSSPLSYFHSSPMLNLQLSCLLPRQSVGLAACLATRQDLKSCPYSIRICVHSQ